ncbi:HAD-IA family hydrolase [Aureimonas populi]|uniref:HAD-IA family hydrolase n=1 Tax=Aureimonas populi TaxID=1701758 RepID=A0ABW5CR19_9HYPH|nr:HAD-IA family hydrolase [Aureimonas populi]
MRLVLFDCDGTLADSFPIICRTMRLAFERTGRAAPQDVAIHAIIGLSLERAFAQLAPDASPAEVVALAETYRSVFRESRNEFAFDEPLFPGIAPLLASLSARPDVRLGMVTGKSRRGVRRILQSHGIERVFTAIRTADDCPSKPHPAMVQECCGEVGIDPADAIVVGDAIYDMQMAVAAGAGGLGVSWGAASRQALLGAGAATVVDDTAALSGRLDEWLIARQRSMAPAAS